MSIWNMAVENTQFCCELLDMQSTCMTRYLQMSSRLVVTKLFYCEIFAWEKVKLTCTIMVFLLFCVEVEVEADVIS